MSLSIRIAAVALLAVAGAGCVGVPPKQLGGPLPDAPGPAAVQAAPSEHTGRTVRWGGEILAVRNAVGHTDIEVYGRPLYDNAEPKPDGGEGIRFIARLQGFVDPVEYAPGKRLTVRGRLRPVLQRPIGEFDYRYPLVAVEASHLWPAYEPVVEPPWYRDPFYDPWWPYRAWGPWGAHRHWPYAW